jgi:hypothetical protein
MIDTLMMEVNAEGGPRCGCRDCYWKTEEELRAVYDLDQGKEVMDDGIAIEEETGFTMKQGKSLKSIVEQGRQCEQVLCPAARLSETGTSG